MENTIHHGLVQKIISCAIEVYKTLGIGFSAEIYKEAFEIELTNEKLTFQKNMERPILYKGVTVGKCNCDFIVGNNVLIDILVVPEIDDDFVLHTTKDKSVFELETGLLLNFGKMTFEYKII